jgi:hypothetical protein
MTPGTLPIINACFAVPAPSWTPPALAVLLTALTGHSFALSSVGIHFFVAVIDFWFHAYYQMMDCGGVHSVFMRMPLRLLCSDLALFRFVER